jgi:hypothetical protein
MWKGCLLNDCRDKHIFIALLEEWIFDVQDEDGHNSSFSLGTGHDSILESAEEE